MSLQIRDSEQVALSVEALDSEGNEAAATVAWSSSDDSIVSITDLGLGRVLAVASPGSAGLGTATITATVTDTSDGDTHVGTLEIEVVAGDAVTVNVLAGDPEPKPV